MRKNKQKKDEKKIQPMTPKDLAEEKRKYDSCKKPVKVGWAIYGIAAALYLVNGMITTAMVGTIPKQPPIHEQLSEYKYTEEYNDYVTETQNVALDQLLNGEITMHEYNHIVETVSSDEKFEEFLRGLENDKEAQKIIEEYDEYANKMNDIGKTYAKTNIASLSSVLIATLILAKYRFREMDIDDKRKNRAKELHIDLEKLEELER